MGYPTTILTPALALTVLTALVLPAGRSERATRDTEALRKELNEVAGGFRGRLGYSLHHLKTGDRLDRLGEEEFPNASTIKLAMLCAALEKQQKGEIDFDEARPLTETVRCYGTGFIHNYREGTKIGFRELAHMLIAASDNTASTILGHWLGADAINDWLQAHGLAVDARQGSAIGLDLDGDGRIWGITEWFTAGQVIRFAGRCLLVDLAGIGPAGGSLRFVETDVRLAEVGQAVPPLSLSTADGKTHATAMIPGKLHVIDFWASWCAPCVAKLPKLKELAREVGDELVVNWFSIDASDGAAKAREIADRLELPVERLVIGGKGSDDAVWQVRLRTHRAHGGSHLRASSVGVGA